MKCIKQHLTLQIGQILFMIPLCAVLAFFCELFREAVIDGIAGQDMTLLVDPVNKEVFLRITFFFVLLLISSFIAMTFWGCIAKFAFRYRYVISLMSLISLVVCDISGSSSALWGWVLSEKPIQTLDGVLFGIPRLVRSDEWVVFSPLAFSQEYSGYAAISPLPRGTDTDLTMVYGQPSWALATIFRPFLWGFMLLGSSKGLSFFWCARLIMLSLVSFEFCRLVSNDNRKISLAYSLMVSFAPIVQWWFAINGIAELLIFGQGMVLALNAFFCAFQERRRIAFAAAFSYCVGGFIMVLYPAWLISIGYIILGLLTAIILIHLDSIKQMSVAEGIRAFIPLALSLLVLFCTLVSIFCFSFETIQVVANTVYPGGRVSTGGSGLPKLFEYAQSWLFSALPNSVLPNPCTSSTFFCLFPLGILVALFALWHKRDPVIICVLLPYSIMLFFMVFGFDEWFAKLTLLSMTTTNRVKMAVEFADIIMLIRGIAVLKSAKKQRSLKPLHVFGTALACLAFSISINAAYAFYGGVVYAATTVCAVVFVALGTYAASIIYRDNNSEWMIIGVSIVICVSGFCINPVQQGISELKDSSFSDEVSMIVEKDPEARWISEDWKIGQALIAMGARTINSTNIYPNLQLWKQLDPDEEYLNVYNRYAHISVIITDEDTEFLLKGEEGSSDLFILKLNTSSLRELGVDYIITTQILEDFDSPRVSFIQLAHVSKQTIYHICY